MRQTPLTMRLNNFFRLRIFIVTPFPNFNLFGYLSKMKGKQKLKVFSIGYQGVSQQDYIEALIEAGVGMVIDVREHPWSQRPEFIKSLLQKALADHNIDYVHIRSAGNPSINRKKAKTNSECLKLYGKYLSKHRECLSDLLEFIKVAAKSGSPACDDWPEAWIAPCCLCEPRRRVHGATFPGSPRRLPDDCPNC